MSPSAYICKVFRFCPVLICFEYEARIETWEEKVQILYVAQKYLSVA